MNEESNPPIILVGVCGGIAAYKAVDLASRLKKKGAEVTAALSPAATRFVQPLTFSAITGRDALAEGIPAHSRGEFESLYPHLYPATRAHAFVLAPATADMIAHIAHGFGRDVVSTAVLSLPASCHRFFCPSMNVEMWENPAVRENVGILEDRGWVRIGPDAGALACGMEGAGRMAEPPEIAERVWTGLRVSTRFDGRRILITSGPTREYLDPVRFVGNSSSGKMGRALAEAAALMGAEVDFITGPADPDNLPSHNAVTIHRVTSARDMLDAAQARIDKADIAIYAAAVADYTPTDFSPDKKPKDGTGLSLNLHPTPDIAATLNAKKGPGQVSIGFALQTGNGRDEARAKCRDKGFDAIVLNHVDAMGSDHAAYQVLSAGEDVEFEDWGRLDKPACARRILERAGELLADA